MNRGHQLGNDNFLGQINRLAPAAGLPQACNTTGTATNGGSPGGPTSAWKVLAAGCATGSRRSGATAGG